MAALTSTEVGILDGATVTTTELNLLDGVTASTTELNYVDGVTSNVQTQLDAKQASDADLTAIAGLSNSDGNFIVGNGSTWVVESGATARTSLGAQTLAADLTTLSSCQSGGAAALAALTSTEIAILDGATVTTAELNILDGVTSTASELNILDGVTSTTAELNILDGVTATATELNLLDGVTATTTEINYIDGVTSAIQTQLDAKLTSSSTIDGGTY